MSGLLRSNLGHMASGFCLMGAWAAFANLLHPWPAPIWAAVTQGVMTAIITLGLKQMVERVSDAFPDWPGVALPPLLACALSVLLLSTVHRYMGTPEIWITLLVPVTVSTIYAAVYAFSLRRMS